MAPSTNTIRRLSLYRRLLLNLDVEGRTHIFSHDLSVMANVGAAQVRRDLMTLGDTGRTAQGYQIPRLIQGITALLDSPEPQRVALVGLGHLGRAMVDFFRGRRPNLSIAAAFDVREDRINRVIQGCRTYHIDQLSEVVTREGITLGVITVPTGAAQEVGTRMVAAGIQGILNCAPRRLHIPEHVYVENLDMTMSLETLAFFAQMSK